MNPENKKKKKRPDGPCLFSLPCFSAPLAPTQSWRWSCPQQRLRRWTVSPSLSLSLVGGRAFFCHPTFGGQHFQQNGRRVSPRGSSPLNVKVSLGDFAGSIARVMAMEGPVVTALFVSGAAAAGKKGAKKNAIEEISVDMTPKKNMQRELLGGPVTIMGTVRPKQVVLGEKDADLGQVDPCHRGRRPGLARHEWQA